jgi:hypothetical protein
MLWRREKSLAPSRNRTLAIQPAAIPTELSQLLEGNHTKDKAIHHFFLLLLLVGWD